MKVVYHRGALQDLERIQKYIARDDPTAATKVVARIRSTVSHLRDFPYLGRPGPRGTRLLSVPGLPFVVIHRVRGDAVSIVAVFHTSRNRQFQ
jgi:toxin ParE1/3/4